MQFHRTRRRSRGIELTPLIDVVFLLLVFLILTANFQQPSLSLDLPGGTSEDEVAERTVMVELDAQGQLVVDGEPIPRAALASTLSAALEPLTLKAVRLMADERVTYGTLLPVIEEVRAAGAVAVDLVHEAGAP